MLSFLYRILGIFVCGAGGGVLAWALITALGWSGLAGAIAAAFLGMIIATLLWIGAVALSNALRRRK